MTAVLQRELDAVVPVFDAWTHRQTALHDVLRAHADDLPDALADWVAASHELVAARLAEALGPRACVNVFHDAGGCRAAGFPVVDWCAPCRADQGNQ